jgi:ribonucleoside-triphosphate reductase
MTDEYLPTDYQRFIALSRYARYLEEESRRETWNETVDRYFTFMERHLLDNHQYLMSDELHLELFEAVRDLEIMPSMRALMTSGPALLRDNICGYNCAYLPVDHPRAFDEALYILMCGTGVGFSVERQYINKLPEVSEHFEQSSSIISVSDSKSGWARAFKELISMLYSGQQPKWDLTALRPKGAKLKTFGGRSSGPEPLNDLFNFAVKLFRGSTGRRLNSIECHDLMCKVGEVVVVGGVRRSAMISLSNLTDDRMRHAKSGQWWDQYGYRALSNNSVCYTEKPEMGSFMREWESLYDSKSGERGIFNRESAKDTVERIGRRDSNHEFGTNPCSEIILRPNQFCNLSEVVVRPSDNFEDLQRKVRLATILGTFQSTLTNFKYLRKIWKTNTEEERLLGVSMTGIMDHEVTSDGPSGLAFDVFSNRGESLGGILEKLKETAIETNKELANSLGINQSTAITCVKPSGTVSQLVDSASGIHPRFSSYYIRTVRGDTKDPISKFLIDQGVPNEPAIGKEGSTVVFSFPHKSPKGVTMRDDVTALDQLNLWLTYQRHWCEHKPSITVYVREHEWMEVGAFVYKHFDEMSGVSFLPYDNGSYQQAPYQECTEEEYLRRVEEMPKDIDWGSLKEEEDNTTASQELACTGGVCEIVDI